LRVDDLHRVFGEYFSRYAASAQWAFEAAIADGRAAMLVYDRVVSLATPAYFVELNIEGDLVISIRDFLSLVMHHPIPSSHNHETGRTINAELFWATLCQSSSAHCEFFSKAPGFISSRVLSSKDGTRVINYSQWKSAKEVAAFRQDPYFGPYIQRLKALSSAESIEWEVVYDKHV
jgi:heme-degrading monooxygenase HmoA